MNIKLKGTPGIYLVGFMGCGKTTIGRALSERLGWGFVDIDDEIEAREHATIPEIFATQGEKRFREIETETIREHVTPIRAGVPTVMALGGGAFARDGNRELLALRGVTIWLDCPLSKMKVRVQEHNERPLARDLERFEELYHERETWYAQADYRITIEGDDPNNAVDAILALPLF